MKIVTSKQMATLESYAYRNGSSEQEFMEEAGKGAAKWIHLFAESKNYPKTLYLLCGKGNNTGDAYVAGTYLLDKGYRVLSYQIAPLSNSSPLCRKSHQRFLEKGGQSFLVNSIEDDLKFSEKGMIVDALFGTGFHGMAKEPYSSAIKAANLSGLPILSIDIPSGLSGETGVVEGEAICAEETIFLGLPKIGFFLQDGWNRVGKLRYVDFGLPKSSIDTLSCGFVMLCPSLVKPYLPKIVNDRHKYQAGFVTALAGSPGMPGAALLSSLSALRSGAGIVKLLHPKNMQRELSSGPLELVKIPYEESEAEKVVELINKSSAALIGPGLGKDPNTAKLLRQVLSSLKVPSVIDADALTLIAEEKIPLPKDAILTPHIGEMMRLLEKSSPKPHTKEFLDTCNAWAEENAITLLLKGGPTFIFHPGEEILVNPYGDPGMATAGSGDVLTGCLASLLAQKVPCLPAAALGAYLHATAGEQAAKMKTSYSMIASDIIENLPCAFWQLLQY